MKKLTEDQVFDAITTFSSAEYDPYVGCVVYYLHVNEDGIPVMSAVDAEATFTYDITNEKEYFGSEWYDGLEIDAYYGKESKDDADFMAIVADLTKRANKWIEEE